MTGREFFEKHRGEVICSTLPGGRTSKWGIVGFCDKGGFRGWIALAYVSGRYSECYSELQLLQSDFSIVDNLYGYCDYMIMSQEYILESIENTKQSEMLPKYSRHRHKFSPIKFR